MCPHCLARRQDRRGDRRLERHRPRDRRAARRRRRPRLPRGPHARRHGGRAAAIESAGGRATRRHARRARRAQVRALVDGALRDTGRLDIMVNNAGVSYPAPIIDGDPEQWRAMLETNVLALLAGCQAAVRAMRACGAGPHREHLVDRGAAPRLGRLRRHQARGELHLEPPCAASSRRTRSAW